MNSVIEAKGTVDFYLRDSEGNLKDERHIKNLVVTLGKQFIARRMIDIYFEYEMVENYVSSTVYGTFTTAEAAYFTTTDGTETIYTDGSSNYLSLDQYNALSDTTGWDPVTDYTGIYKTDYENTDLTPLWAQTYDAFDSTFQTYFDALTTPVLDEQPNPVSYIYVGTDNTDPNTSDVFLINAVADGYKALTSTTIDGATLTFTTTFEPGEGTGELVEAGLFTGVYGTDDGAIMFSRTTYTAINKASGDYLLINWNITIN